MTPEGQAFGSIVESLKELRLAGTLWDAVDLFRIDQCREMLEAVARQMAKAENLLRSEQGSGSAELRLRVLELKAEARRIERLVDASSAFFRSAFPTAGGESPVYGSGGLIRVEAGQAAVHGVQG